MAILIMLIGAGLPAIIGIHLFRQNTGSELTRMAAWLTIKPFFTTPLCALIFMAASGGPPTALAAAAAIAPGVIVTVMIVSRYAALVFGPWSRSPAHLLLLLDCLRWGSTLALLLLLADSRPAVPPAYGDALAAAVSITAMGMPLVFALAALVIVRVEAKAKGTGASRKRKRGQDALDEFDEYSGV